MITKNKKKIFSFLLAIFVGGGIFFLAPSAHATLGDWAGEVVGGLIGVVIYILGVILALVIKVLVIVAQYSDFIGSAAVTAGWKIVRDLCNMFFVLVLLIIAFATILKIENYSYKKYLPKLILMAILINFSKTICGLLIDFAQVIMLTFVNAFKDVAGGNLITNLGITDVLTLAKDNADVGFWAIIGAYGLGLIYILIAFVVMVTMLAMLVMRIVMIWIYIVLSPAAYLFSAFPGGQKYASQWWDEFTKNLIVGPVLAFFIWLSFISLQAPGNIPGFASDETSAEKLASSDMNIDTSAATTNQSSETPFTASKASTPSVLIKFIIGIGMLIGGLKISQEIGGAAGSIAGKGMAAIQKGGIARKALGKVASGDNYFARKFAKSTGWDFRPVKLAENFKASMASSKKKDESEITRKSKEHFNSGNGLESVFMGAGAGEDYFNRYTQGFLATKGIKQAAKDIFVNPRKRKELGGEMDKSEKAIKELDTQKHEMDATHKEGLENSFYAMSANDTDLTDLRSKKETNDQTIKDLNEKKENSTLTKVEEKKLSDTERDNQKISDKITKKESEVRKESENKYYSGLKGQGMQTMDVYVKNFADNDKDLTALGKEISQNFVRISELEGKKSSKGYLDDKDTQEWASLKQKNENLEEKKKTARKEVESAGQKKYISTVTGKDKIELKLEANKDSLKKLKDQIMKYQKPVAFQSRSEYRKGIEESKTKYKTLTNADELLKALADATQRKDKFDTVAILEKLSGDGNLNEEMKDKGYGSDAKGLFKYINNLENDFGEKKGLTGFSQEGRLQIMNDLGESEERVNHWDMAKMVGMNSKGEMESLVREKKDASGNTLKDAKGKTVYDDTDHAAASYAEIMKMDPQKVATSLNRLAYGGEDGSGKFQLATLGKMLYKALAENGTYIKQEGRVQTNLASNLSDPSIIPILQQLLRDNQKQSSDTIKALTNRGGSNGMTFGVNDMINWIRELGA